MMIFKCIGFLLLGLIGFFLFLVLLILFVPLRYEGEASFYEKTPKGRVKLSWLLHLIHVGIQYEEELDIRVKILGMTVFPKKEKLQPVTIPVTESATEKKLEKPTEVTKPLPPHEDEEVFVPTESTGSAAMSKKKAETDDKVSMKDRFTSVKSKILEVRVFLSDAENQKTLCLIKNELFHLLYQLRPRKLKAYAHFGFNDPYTTGQVLSYASMVYALYYRHVTLEPDFENEIIEGDIYMKGRFRAATLVRVLLKLLFNKNLRKQVNRFIKR